MLEFATSSCVMFRSSRMVIVNLKSQHRPLISGKRKETYQWWKGVP